MRACSAVIAASSSSPSVSISTSLPNPAASIITPMMLLALTRRPLRLRKMSQRKLPASLLSLADARACRPSLLLILTVAFIMAARPRGLELRPRRRDLHHPLGGARKCAGDEGFERFERVAQRAPEHRHIHPGDDLDPDAVGEPLRDVARRRSEHVGEDEDLRGGELLDHHPSERFDL